MLRGKLNKEDLNCGVCGDRTHNSMAFGLLISIVCLNKLCTEFRIMKVPFAVIEGNTTEVHDSELRSEN